MVETQQALTLLGRFLGERGAAVELVLLGGASLRARELTSRATQDVDVFGIRLPDGSVRSAYPLDDVVVGAARDVAEVLGLATEPAWLDDRPGIDFEFGAPPRFEDRLERQEFGALVVWHLARSDILAIKVLVAAEQRGDPDQKHLEDVLALRPTPSDLRHALAYAEYAWTSSNASWPSLRLLLEELADA
jgi:hypothetical protein